MRRLITAGAVIMLLLSLCACSASNNQAETRAPAPNTVEITFDYAKQSGFASNQFAVWIEDADGNLVKTLYVTRYMANGGYKNRPDIVPVWREKSDPASMTKSEIDAITGATPKQGTLSYTWDLTDTKGNAVLPGVYSFFVEGSLRWKNRVLYSGVIAVGGQSPITATANAAFVYESSGNQPALTDASPETAMIGPVTANFVPAADG